MDFAPGTRKRVPGERISRDSVDGRGRGDVRLAGAIDHPGVAFDRKVSVEVLRFSAPEGGRVGDGIRALSIIIGFHRSLL